MHIYKVGELLQEVNVNLWASFGNIAVEGEVTNCLRPASGHIYFTIKDPRGQLSIVLFAMYARTLKFRLENGLHVVVRGKLNIYEQRGSFQLNAVAVEPAGLGALQLAYEQMKKRLQDEGLFDASRKKPIPPLPQKIAIVTSSTGAAIRDILNVLGRRFQGLEIQIYPVRVQGATAAREIALAVNNLSRWQIHDVILICRGGGSLEDLWPFNEEIVARAVANCSIPTISGVGHEIDFTICDFVADLRAPTPSAAAEIVVRAKAEICSQIDHGVRRIREVIQRRVATYRHELRHFASSDGLGRVPRTIEARRARLEARRGILYRLLERHAKVLRQRLDLVSRPLAEFPSRLALEGRRAHLERMGERGDAAMRHFLAKQRQRLRSTTGTLDAVSPLSVLSRGYAIAFAKRGRRNRPVLDSMSVEVGEAIEVQLKKGRLLCTIDGRTMGLESVWPEV
ncbi:MAG TPA: exodeoxyribonuclease VII large subunit, partial [Thermoanaerobaculia bacterium]|nr:exodeoxyribonuclease VII large subunit [Thermoanaerobaculia bacterium]